MMSDPTPRPALLEGTPTLTPWWRRPSNGALLVAGVMAVASEFPRFAEQIAPFVRDDWRPGLRLAAMACTFLAVVLVRMGVTRSDQKTETLAARTEEKLNQ